MTAIISRFHIATIFPELFSGFLSCSLIEKAISKGLVSFSLHQIRDFADPPHYQVDDTPYGGGAGMVMKPEPIVRVVEKIKEQDPHSHVVLLSASGSLFSQAKAETLASKESITFVCGRYEGIDQRAIDEVVDEELSIGNFVVMGGEVPAMVVTEAVLRLKAEVIGNAASLTNESFATGGKSQLLEAPQYTRPPLFRNRAVPEVLTSGNHKLIEAWRSEQAHARTLSHRPDLLKK